MRHDLIGKKVVVFEFGEPTEKNVIGYDCVTDQYQLQTEGHFGYYWCYPDRFLHTYQINWHFIQKSAFEVKRLQIKNTIISNID
ncbi:hypothetical protein [Flavobacterium sp. NRK1]|uniref:hypothetical protein n=1 Tax=Flavobacterium sp. NRK1 TaxID=2954929 RepID=UPI002093E87B|nr:hypothetical protein [Flavobacterium sp. NRK1]MCO6149071.1 hypothetical protein [Flavobacterium sp. NRK1]